MEEPSGNPISNAVFQRSLLSYASQNAPVTEPVLAQRDDDSIRRLEELCWAFEPLFDPEGKPVFNEKKELMYHRTLKYPDIYALLSSIGHLEGTTGLTWESSRALYLIWEGKQFKPVWKRHKRDRDAQNILRQIHGIRTRQSIGDSYRGFRAEHVENVSGSIRRFEMREQNVNNGRFPV